jgi:hypothetical protein
MQRRLPVERAIVRGNQILGKGQPRRQCAQLLPEAPFERLFVFGQTLRQRFGLCPSRSASSGVGPRCLVTKWHRKPPSFDRRVDGHRSWRPQGSSRGGFQASLHAVKPIGVQACP